MPNSLQIQCKAESGQGTRTTDLDHFAVERSLPKDPEEDMFYTAVGSFLPKE